MHFQSLKKILPQQCTLILLFADDQIITAESETLLQKSIHKLENITSKCGLTISSDKTKTMQRKRPH
jgi:hypothetical protein